MLYVIYSEKFGPEPKVYDNQEKALDYVIELKAMRAYQDVPLFVVTVDMETIYNDGRDDICGPF